MVFDISFEIKFESYQDIFSKAFMSSNDEEYVVNVGGFTNYSYDWSRCTVTVSWKKMSRRFLRFRSYKESSREILSDVKLFANDNQFKIISSEMRLCQINCRTLVVINIISYDSIPKYLDSKPAGVKQSVTIKEPVVQKRLEHLSTDMKNLLQTGHLWDVTLTDGSEEIHAHKVILSMRSPVFSKMFQHPMKENNENLITIKDISIEVLKSLLTFMYTGTVVLNDMDMTRDLYVAADKYDVKNLKNICSEMLKSVNLNNVIDTLLLADFYQDTQLKQAALNFIGNNYSRLKSHNSWSKFMKENQSLAIEVLSFVIDKK